MPGESALWTRAGRGPRLANVVSLPAPSADARSVDHGFFAPEGPSDFSRDRLRWLVRLRWGAMLGAASGAVAGALGVVPSVAWPVMAVTAAVGTAYNFLLWRALRAGIAPTGARAALTQAIVDLFMLTVFLWAAGGIECPFRSFYIFHVALIAILGGPRWTLAAAGAALCGAGLLAAPSVWPAMEIGRWDPSPKVGLLAEIAAFVATLAGTAYIVLHAARELRYRESALAEARDRAELEYQLLSNTLDELEAGLEVLDTGGQVLWRNKRAEELTSRSADSGPWECLGAQRPCERDGAECPVVRARRDRAPGRCRFAATVDGVERVYEMLAFPIDERQSASRTQTEPRVMNLYVDRTQATLAEARLMLAERLASLGRVAQGVAHELNTPLATIRTLATDMRHALADLDPEIARDLDESATLIRDETRRLGRITQALLAGGDLVRTRAPDNVPLSAAVERARAIVTAGMRGGGVVVDDHLTHFRVTADVDRLVQVLVNLLQNALDASRESGQAVHVDAREGSLGVALEVRDEGPGLDPEMARRLFEPFATTKPPGEGTGLGLYTSYMLVQEMGGQLTLENREAGGAVARIDLPGGRV